MFSERIEKATPKGDYFICQWDNKTEPDCDAVWDGAEVYVGNSGISDDDCMVYFSSIAFWIIAHRIESDGSTTDELALCTLNFVATLCQPQRVVEDLKTLERGRLSALIEYFREHRSSASRRGETDNSCNSETLLTTCLIRNARLEVAPAVSSLGKMTKMTEPVCCWSVPVLPT